MIVLAHVGLELAEIGQFEALKYIGFTLTGFWLNALGNAYLRVRQNTGHHERWFVFYLLIALLGGLLVFGLFSTSLSLLGGFLLDVPNLGFGLAFGTFLLGSLAGTVVEQEAVGDQATVRLLTFSLTSYGLQLLLFLVPLILGYPLFLAMWGLAASAVYRLAWALLRYMHTRDGKMPSASERKIFWSSAAGLSAYGLASITVTAIDHALVGYVSDGSTQALAIWRYGAQELPLLLGVVSAANATALAEMQLGTKNMLTALLRRGSKLTNVFLPLSCLLLLTSKYWYPLVFSQDFYAAHVIFNTMLLLVPSRLVLTSPMMISLDLQRQMTVVGVIENILNVVISLALVSSLGMLGITIGTVVAFSVERLIHVWMLIRRGITIDSYFAWKSWLAWSIVMLFAYIIGTDFTALPAL